MDLDRLNKAREDRQATRKPAAQRPATPGHRPRRKVDLDAVPEGYDANVWEVALFFEELAEERGFQLAAGRPVLYAKLEDRVTKSGLRNVQSWRGKPLRWVPLIKAMIIDFWDDEVWLASAAHAIDQFCGVEVFTMLRDQILREHELKQVKASLVKQPDRDRRADPHVQARIAARQAEQEQLPRRRDKPRRSWEEIREAVARMNGRTGE